jgi:hypothetical protein
MDIGSIVIIALAATALGTGLYFQFTGKKNVAKAIYIGVGVFLVAVGIMDKGKLTKIKEEGQAAIDDSKENDENRNDVVEVIEERVKSNKELIDEINEALGDN